MISFEKKKYSKGLFDNYFKKIVFHTLKEKTKKTLLIIKKTVFYFIFLTIKNKVFFKNILKLIIQIYKMIKNKTLHIKFIFKTYLQILKIC